MKNKILKLMELGVTIIMFFMMQYNVSTSWAERGNKALDPNDEKRKKRQSSQETDIVCPSLLDPQWQKIGKVDTLCIYPVKSSQQPNYNYTYDFFDYGMYKQLTNGTYIYDGMFIVYNRTRDKFEDARRYPLLRNIKMTMELQENTEMTLHDIITGKTSYLDTYRIRNPFNSFIKETWSGDFGTFYRANKEVNIWVQDVIDASLINGREEDVTLTQTIPSNFSSIHKIRSNWNHFVQEYERMEGDLEGDNTGKLVTLPRIVLMTFETKCKLKYIKKSPNVVIKTDKLINPFEEKNWDWIKLGENVILKNVRCVPRGNLNEEFQHRGIYCGLWTGGSVSKNDDVFVYSRNLSPTCSKTKLNTKTKLKFLRI